MYISVCVCVYVCIYIYIYIYIRIHGVACVAPWKSEAAPFLNTPRRSYSALSLSRSIAICSAVPCLLVSNGHLVP